MTSNRLFTLALLVLCVSIIGFSQESQDVVILKDGTRLVGRIETIVPDKSLTFVATDGTRYVLDWSRIERIEKGERAPAATPTSYKPGLESWYAYFALGHASTTYPGPTRQYIDQSIQPFGPQHIALALDFLGFYWPLANERTIVGFVISGSADRYEYTAGISGKTEIQFNQYIYAASIMHFFGEIPGDGPFLRGELGPAAMVSDLASEGGFGAQVSVGYGIPLSVETRILVQTGYAFRHLDSGNCNTWNITIGLLL